MGKAHIIQSNFTGGEIDPTLRGRVDVARYKNGAETLKNAVVRTLGGASRRPGLKYQSHTAKVTVRLIPLVVYRTTEEVTPARYQGYMVALRSDGTTHFYTQNAQILSGGAPYSKGHSFSNIDKFKYAHYNNGALYLAHPDYSIMSLYRSAFAVGDPPSDTYWIYADFAPLQPATTFWDATNGYPSAICFYEQRMLLAASKTKPNTIWGSQSGAISNFVTGGAGDSDPFEFTATAADTKIAHMTASQEQVFISTFNKELSMSGGSDKAVTPSNVLIKEQTRYGTGRYTLFDDGARPEIVGGEYVFASRSGKKLRTLGYRFEKDRSTAPDISKVSGHLMQGGIKSMVYTSEPEDILWIVTDDGMLLSLTYDPDQEVVAWARHTTDGLFKDVSAIPHNGRDQVWVVVDRVIGGTTYTFVETLDGALNTDSAITGTDGPGKATWTGLSHLEGETVDIVADGVVMPQQVVTGGQVTLPRNANLVEIGLHYETEIKDLPPDLAQAGGTTQGLAVSVNRAVVRLHESKGCEINGEVVPFRKFGDGVLDQNITSFSGDKEVRLLGWESKGVVTIKQTQPLPLMVLAIIKEVTVNG